MNWSGQADAMMNVWGEAQKKMWENWYNLMQTGSNSHVNPFMLYPEMMKQWQQMASQGLENWTSGADPVAKNVARQLIASQEATTRFLETFNRAWQAIAPKIEAGEDWQSVLREYGNQWYQSLVGGPTAAMNVGKDTNELWQFYQQEWMKVAQPWMQFWQQSPGHFGQVMIGGGTELAQLMKMHWDLYERTFGGLTEVPGLGYNRELNAKLLGGFDSWLDLQRASADFYSLIARAQTKSFELFMEKLVEMSEKGEKIESIRDLINLWMETIDFTFTRMYVSEEYLEAQRQMSSAGMRNRMDQRKIIEVVLKMADMPTRSELDDAYRSLYELNKEVRALKKAMKGHNETAREVEVKARPARKTPAKKAAGNGAKPEETTMTAVVGSAETVAPAG